MPLILGLFVGTSRETLGPTFDLQSGSGAETHGCSGPEGRGEQFRGRL